MKTIIPDTQELIDAFEARLRELIDEGMPVKEAVQQAYSEYPVMHRLRQEIEISLPKEAEKGYGGALSGVVGASVDAVTGTASVEAALSMPWTADKLKLSARTTGGSVTVQKRVGRILEEQIRRNGNYKKNAMAIFDGYRAGGAIPVQDIPKFMKRLITLSNGSDAGKEQFAKEVKSIRKYINKLHTKGMRAMYDALVSAIETRNEAAIHKAIFVATQERTRYFAERIARTERARAWVDGFLAKWQHDDDCIAYQYQLSSRHPKRDICDLYANADLYGMGKGIFPKDKVPNIPVHPHCMCRLKPVIRGMIDNETPVERIEEGGREYIATLNRIQKEQLLGVYGSKSVEAGDPWTEHAVGYSRTKLKGRLAKATADDIINIEAVLNEPLPIDGVRFIPRRTVVMPKRVIAGAFSDTTLRVAEQLAEKYGGEPSEWSKMVGTVLSDKHIFDIHWYRHKDCGDVEFKVKLSKKRRDEK